MWSALELDPNPSLPPKQGFGSVTPKADPGKGSCWCCRCQGVTLSEKEGLLTAGLGRAAEKIRLLLACSVPNPEHRSLQLFTERE